MPSMSLVTVDKSNFQFIIRLLNTNIDGKQKVSERRPVGGLPTSA